MSACALALPAIQENQPTPQVNDSPTARHVPCQFNQRVNGVDAHHLVVDIGLKTIQTPRRRFRSVARQAPEFDGGTVQFSGLHLHLNGMVRVDEQLLADTFR